MFHRIFVAAFAMLLCCGVNAFAQEKTSPISPSDIPVDQIKNAAQIKAEQEKAAQEAAAKKAEKAKAAAKPAEKPNDQAMKEAITPTPIAEGTVVEGKMVAEPCCGCDATPACGPTCELVCDPCSGRGKLLNRIRWMFQRRGCR